MKLCYRSRRCAGIAYNGMQMTRDRRITFKIDEIERGIRKNVNIPEESFQYRTNTPDTFLLNILSSRFREKEIQIIGNSRRETFKEVENIEK